MTSFYSHSYTDAYASSISPFFFYPSSSTYWPLPLLSRFSQVAQLSLQADFVSIFRFFSSSKGRTPIFKLEYLSARNDAYDALNL